MPLAIQFENVSKQYRLGEVGTGTLSHDLHRWWARLRGRPDPFAKVGAINDRTQQLTPASSSSTAAANSRATEFDYVWALKDIDFDVQEGEILGIIGRNGAGKSTLLKLLSRVTAPTTGRIKAKGRIASLLEVGTGFHPELTGRENIYINGAILGMRRHEITRQLEAIVQFSGCAKYIDTPVKRYSSGMKVRLGFAVAAHLDCEVLVVDEVLAVGDAEFQKKCIGKMQEVSTETGKTVLFVSHNMASVRSLCKEAVVLDAGRVLCRSKVAEAVKQYLSINRHGENVQEWTSGERSTVPFSLDRAAVCPMDTSNDAIHADESFVIEITYTLRRDFPPMRVGFLVCSAEGAVLVEAYDCDSPINRGTRSRGTYTATCVVPGKLIRPGLYFVTINAGIPNVENLWHADGLFSFTIENTSDNTDQRVERQGFIQPEFDWEVTNVPKIKQENTSTA